MRHLVFLISFLFFGSAYAQLNMGNRYGKPVYWYTDQPGKVNPLPKSNIDTAAIEVGYQAAAAGDEYFRNYQPPECEYQPSQTVLNLRESKVYLKAQVVRRNQIREQIKGMEFYETRSEIVETATDAMRISKQAYLDEDFETGSIAANIADVLLDIATSVTPVVGWWRDLYEAISGKDLLSGEELGTFSRSMAVLGAVTVGFGSKIGKAMTVTEKLMKGEKAAEAIDLGRKMLNGNSTLWTKTKDRTTLENAYKHFQDHRHDFPHFPNALKYVEGAHDFMKNPPSDVLIKVRKGGDKVFYHPNSNVFAIQTVDGVPRTMYKPGPKTVDNPRGHNFATNLEYFHAQQ